MCVGHDDLFWISLFNMYVEIYNRVYHLYGYINTFSA